MGDAISAVTDMPMTPAYTYGAVTASALTGTGNGTITALSVTGTPRPGIYRLKVTTAVANGGVWTLTDPKGSVVSSTITMAPGAGGATVITVGGIQFTLTDGSTDFGLGAYFDITVAATKINLQSVWKAANANGLVVEVLPDQEAGVAFAITQPTGGLTTPDVSGALAQIGNVWESICLNAASDIADTTTLDLFMNYGEGRWGTIVHKPLVVFTGNTIADPTLATAVASGRRTDRINAQIAAPGSPTLPFMVAARAVCQIAKVAQNSPPSNYSARTAHGRRAGARLQQWDWTVADFAVKRGSSTSEVVDSVPQLSDVMTFYRPTGEEPPAYRYVVDIVREMNIIYNIALIFAAEEWAGAPLVPDSQATTLPEARKPKHAKAEVAAALRELGPERHHQRPGDGEEVDRLRHRPAKPEAHERRLRDAALGQLPDHQRDEPLGLLLRDRASRVVGPFSHKTNGERRRRASARVGDARPQLRKAIGTWPRSQGP
jgi:phage tail sheath gpL-like